MVEGEVFLDINLEVYHWYNWRKYRNLVLPERVDHFYVINSDMSNCFHEFRKGSHATVPGKDEKFSLFPNRAIVREFLIKEEIPFKTLMYYGEQFLEMRTDYFDKLCEYIIQLQSEYL